MDMATILLEDEEFHDMPPEELFILSVEIILNETEMTPVLLNVGHVDTTNVAFSMDNDDVSLITGGMDFASHIGKTVWNYQDVPEDEE